MHFKAAKKERKLKKNTVKASKSANVINGGISSNISGNIEFI